VAVHGVQKVRLVVNGSGSGGHGASAPAPASASASGSGGSGISEADTAGVNMPVPLTDALRHLLGAWTGPSTGDGGLFKQMLTNFKRIYLKVWRPTA
jgi:hypothetical protein